MFTYTALNNKTKKKEKTQAAWFENYFYVNYTSHITTHLTTNKGPFLPVKLTAPQKLFV